MRILIGLLVLVLLLAVHSLAQPAVQIPRVEELREWAWPKHLDKAATLVGSVQLTDAGFILTFREPSGAIKIIVAELRSAFLQEYRTFALKP